MMAGILLSEGAKIQPIGWILIIGFAALIIYLAIYDKKNAKRFDEEFEKTFQDKKVFGNDKIFITTGNELIVRERVNGASGYRILKLDDVKYILSAWDITTKMWHLGLYGEDKKVIKGERYHSGKKGANKVKGYFSFSREDVELIEMLVKHIPKAQLVGRDFKEYKGNYKES